MIIFLIWLLNDSCNLADLYLQEEEEKPKKKKKRKQKKEKGGEKSPIDPPIDPDEPTYCLCEQVPNSFKLSVNFSSPSTIIFHVGSFMYMLSAVA